MSSEYPDYAVFTLLLVPVFRIFECVDELLCRNYDSPWSPSHCQYLQVLTTDDYEYSENIKNIKSTDGSRLVGAREAQTQTFPFLVGWNQYGMDNSFSCTGSLITPSYFLSAAHCNGVLEQSEERAAKRQECVETTARGEQYIITKFFGELQLQVQCKWLQEGDLEVKTIPPGKAWIGIDDVTSNKKRNAKHMREVKRHIRHAESYQGGGKYGHYGGYDITLVELESPMYGYQPACLPSPHFDDIRLEKKDSMLAGYGKYLRSRGETCETNKYGQMKMHYCDKEEYVGGYACITDRPPPVAEECKTFYDNEATPNSFPQDGKEIRIKDQLGKTIAFCFPNQNPENQTYGWCKTKGSYYNPDMEDYEHVGWGFCGKDCFLDTNTKNSGILRQKQNVEILSEELCDAYLDRSLKPFGKPAVRPKILCVARTEKWKETTWQKTEHGYHAVPSTGPAMRYGSTSYIASVGTCQGDSGGPVFVRQGHTYVVTGIIQEEVLILKEVMF